MSEVVKYDNKMNLLAFKGVTKLEYDLFFSVIARLKDKGTQEITLSYAELTDKINWNLTNEEIRLALINGAEKIVKTAVRWDTEDGTTIFSLFEKFYIPNSKEPYLKAKINKTFLDILNNFKNGNFTMLELAEFSSLNSKYTQTLYRLLKQFRGEGALFLEWDKFLDLLDIPKSYGMSDIDKQILKPAIKELSEKTLFSDDRVIFNNLRYEKIRGRGRGRPVKNINFYFKRENTDNKKQISEKKQKAKLKAENEYKEFSNQFYGKKIKSTNGETFLIYKIYKNSDGTITADLENFSKLSYGKTYPYNFENLETLKKLISEYEENNPKKDRPKVRKFFK